jgi:hypothetical protein
MAEIFLQIITSPFIQLFILGLLAGFFKSDLELPKAFVKALSIYLMLAIGLKGGLAIGSTTAPISEISTVLLSGVFLAVTIPMIAYFLLRKTTNLSRLDAAAICAHYGSVSAVTFSYGLTFLKNNDIPYEGYVLTLMAIMEFPAILMGLIFAKRSVRLNNATKEKLFSTKVLKEVFLNGSIVLLIGGLLVGMTANDKAMENVKPYLIDPFYGILCLFLLELGLVAAKEMQNNKNFPLKLALFGVYMPLISASIALGISWIFNFELGTAILLSILSASASYIAVPAAMRIALPEANAGYYITLALCITFPFNLILGIPIYAYFAKMLLGG